MGRRRFIFFFLIQTLVKKISFRFKHRDSLGKKNTQLSVYIIYFFIILYHRRNNHDSTMAVVPNFSSNQQVFTALHIGLEAYKKIKQEFSESKQTQNS